MQEILLLLCSSLGFSFLFGFFEYQQHYPVQGIAVSKLKGVSVYVLNGSEPFLQNCETNDINRLVFDSPEYSIIDVRFAARSWYCIDIGTNTI